MRESILTIPVNEVFEPREGCPFCRMRDTVELHICEYIMGAAMMEPDVRMETNALGFCHTHFLQLLKQNNRLSLGLMLNSHLETVRKDVFGKKIIFAKNRKTRKASGETCFVCAKTDWGMNHMLKTVFVMFRDDPKFKDALKAQEFICMPHYAWLRGKAEEQPKSERAGFIPALDGLVGNYAESLNLDVGEFCDSFDYRNAGKLHSPDMERVREAVNRAVYFLTGRPPRSD
ncbi:MAG: DUF6062 family protein [Oscillospiraceae bacterium]|nr:DUF6062 family protein [Oscillospiraceae bacterium]